MEKYTDYNWSDFLKDEFFVRWVNSPDTESDEFWTSWMKLHPHKVMDVMKAKEAILFLKSSSTGVELSKDNSMEILERLLKQSSAGQKVSVKYFPNRYLKVAASLILLASVFVGWWLRQSDRTLDYSIEVSSKEIVKINPSGQKSQIFLRDGTKVVLSHASTLKYTEPFSTECRDVFLEGEAFFDVAEDASKPFKVIAGDIVTKAIGTSFNINSRQNGSREVQVSLTSGKVQVHKRLEDPHSIGKKYFLEPGQAATYNLDNDQFIISEFDEKEILAWRHGIISFQHASRPDVIETLEQWYGVDIIESNNADEKWDLTAKFDNKSLEKVLMSLAHAMEFDYQIEEKTVRIKYNP